MAWIMSTRRDPHDNRTNIRSEPTLGDLDRVDDPLPGAPDGLPQVTVEPRRARRGTPPSASPRRRGGHWRWLAPLLLLLALVVAGLLWFNQGNLRGMLPRTDLNGVLTQAQQALKDGHLDGQDGNSARELFQQVAAQEPDNDRARDGLRQVGQAELSRADAALQAGQLDEAAQHAAVARELLGGGSDIDRLDALIVAPVRRRVQAGDLVEQAQQALAAGKLDGAQGAGALYQRMRRRTPVTRSRPMGWSRWLARWRCRRTHALEANEPAKAGAHIEELAALQPNNGALPALRALQAQMRQQQVAR